MGVQLNENEKRELRKLHAIIQDKTKSPGQRRIAMARYDRIMYFANQRTYNKTLEISV